MEKEMPRERAPQAAAPAKSPEDRRAPRYVPAIDIGEDDHRYVVSADMPGCAPEDIDVRFEQGMLTILGRTRPRSQDAQACLSCEYGVGDFYRKFNLGDAVSVDRIEAACQDGVMTLVLPKVESAKPRKIEVRTGAGDGSKDPAFGAKSRP